MSQENGQGFRGKILVAIGPSPNSAHLIEWAHANAEALASRWVAVHVDSGALLGPDDERRLDSNLALARVMGAETSVVKSADVPRGIVDAARACGATMIVIGRSGLSRLGPFPKRATVSDRIVREAGGLDVIVIQDALAPRRALTLGRILGPFKSPVRQYALLAAGFVAASVMGWFIEPLIGYRNLALVYLSMVLGLSFLARPGPVAAFAVLSALSLDYFFISPHFTLSISALDDLFLFAAYFAVAFATGTLVSRLRAEGRRLSEREATNAFLLSSTRRLAECASLEDALRETGAILSGHFGGLAEAFAGGPGEAGPEGGTAPEGQPPGDGWRVVPAMLGERQVGLLALRPPAGRPWRRDDELLAASIGRTLALIIERERSEERSRKAALAVESERLAKVLLDSVSHELRTPLTTITGSLSALKDPGFAERSEVRTPLVDEALDAADRLNRLVEDLLSVSRIEAAGFRLNLSYVDVADLANASLDAARPEVEEGRVMLELPAGEHIARLDAGLAARLAANLLRNAARYSPPGSPIGFTLAVEGRDLALLVRDHGPGVPEGELQGIFDRFSRGRNAKGGGLGLGLAICRGIAAAHGGSIEARNLEGGGLEARAVFPGCVEEVEA